MSRTLPQQIITNALAIVANPRRWTRYVATRGARGERSHSMLSADVQRYCAFAALVKSSFDLVADARQAQPLALMAEKYIVAANGWQEGSRLAKFNDAHCHREVIAALRLAEESRTL